MAEDVSIAISVRDNYSAVMNNISRAFNSLGADSNSLQRRLDTLNRTKAVLQVDVERAKQSLKEMQRAFRNTGTEEARQNLIQAQEEYNNIKTAVDAVTQSERELQRQIRETNSELSNATTNTNATATVSNATNGTPTNTPVNQNENTNFSFSSFVRSREMGNALRQIANWASKNGQVHIASRYGEETGIIAGATVSGIGSGAATGATLGSLIAPGIGTAIGGIAGGIVGGVAGVISGNTQVFAKRDDFFKNLVQESYNDIIQADAEMLNTGKQIASQRTTDITTFTKLLGSRGAAEKYMEDLVEIAKTTPFQYDGLVDISKTLATYGYSTEQMKNMITNIGDAGAALGMDTNGIKAVATYLGRMKSTGKTTLEYINPLIERGIPVIDYLAGSLGKSKEDVYEMVSKGLIPGAEAAEIIADNLGKTFGGGMDELSKQTSGLESTIEDAKAEIQNAYGKGYNEERTKGLEEEKAWYEQNGKKLELIYEKIGQARAKADNEKTRSALKQYDKILNDKETWKTLRLWVDINPDSDGQRISEQWLDENMDAFDYDATNKINELWTKIASAEKMGEIEFSQSNEYQSLLNAQLKLVDMLGEELKPTYEALGYRMMQHFTNGLDSYGTGTGLDKAMNMTDEEVDKYMETYLNDYEENFGSGIVSQPFQSEGMTTTEFITGVEEAIKRGHVFSEEMKKRYEDVVGTTMEADFHINITEVPLPNSTDGASHAYGLPYVPYNDYPAMLHEGERVLTASENRAYSQGYIGGISVTINGMTVREEADIYKIAEEIYREIKLANANYAEVN